MPNINDMRVGQMETVEALRRLLLGGTLSPEEQVRCAAFLSGLEVLLADRAATNLLVPYLLHTAITTGRPAFGAAG